MKSLFFVMKNIQKNPIEESKRIELSDPIESPNKTYNNLVKSTVIILSIKNKFLSLYEPILPKFFLTHHFCLILSELKEKYRNKTLDKKNMSHTSHISPVLFEKKNIFEKKMNYLNDTVYDINPSIIKSRSISKLLNNKRYRDNAVNKKKIFNLNKTSETKKLTNVGRKKKNSGEYGAHNKYSNDNMMRKLKNKIIESARKLISRKIKEESDYEYGELHKIGGEFSQELNIKFNFWFYFQKFKDIFQFKCSTKYRKNFEFTNKTLIENIYLKENINKFRLTKKLLEMSFCQFYHEIFLEENPDWKYIYNIPLEENYYDMHFFINNIRANYEYNPQDDEFYINKMVKLADDYELFFLSKNPRNLKKEKGEINEKNIEIKRIIENLEKFDKNNNELKIQFLLSAAKYRPHLNKYILNLNKLPV